MEGLMTSLGTLDFNALGPIKVNPQILIGVAVVLLIGLVISLMKKAVKAAIVLVVVGFLFASFGPIFTGVLANNGIQFNDNQLSIDIDGRPVNIDLDVVEGFYTSDGEDGNTNIAFKIKDLPEPIVVSVPTPMATIVTTILKASYDLVSLGSDLAAEENLITETIPIPSE